MERSALYCYSSFFATANDVLGKAAPRIDETNVGFRLLTLMGWSEGDRIGASMKGLAAPLPAIIKTSRLGLGAVKSKESK